MIVFNDIVIAFILFIIIMAVFVLICLAAVALEEMRTPKPKRKTNRGGKRNE